MKFMLGSLTTNLTCIVVDLLIYFFLIIIIHLFTFWGGNSDLSVSVCFCCEKKAHLTKF